MKSILLCADDFGLNAEVNQAILNLVDLKRLNAVSAMVNMPLCQKGAVSLCEYSDVIQIGLHLNFTEGKALTEKAQPYFRSLNQLCALSHFRCMELGYIVEEIRAQILAFQQYFGFLPQFIDGHQHVHEFPLFRQALLQAYLEFYPKKSATIRVPAQQSFFNNLTSIKSIMIYLMGARALLKLLKQHQIPHNASFSGIYDFNPESDYRTEFKKFLQKSLSNGLIMCHPGHGAIDPADSIAKARVTEYQYFVSDAFVQDLAEAGVLLG